MKLLGVACVVMLLTAGEVSGQSRDTLPDWSGVWQMDGGTVFDRATASARAARCLLACGSGHLTTRSGKRSISGT